MVDYCLKLHKFIARPAAECFIEPTTTFRAVVTNFFEDIQ